MNDSVTDLRSAHPEPLLCGRYAARDLQWLGRALSRLQRSVEGGPRQTHCSLAALIERNGTSSVSDGPATSVPSNVVILDSLARRETDRAEVRRIEGALERVHARREGQRAVGHVWYRLLREVFVVRRNVDDTIAVLVEAGRVVATGAQLAVWTRRGRLSTATLAKWAREELTTAVEVYDWEVAR